MAFKPKRICVFKEMVDEPDIQTFDSTTITGADEVSKFVVEDSGGDDVLVVETLNHQ
jgi:hypothetical protein